MRSMLLPPANGRLGAVQQLDSTKILVSDVLGYALDAESAAPHRAVGRA
jgi:hypothetical protein